MKSVLVVYEYLTFWDWVVFGFILLLTFSAAFYGQKIKKNNKGGVLEYMLMGRRLTLPMFVATLCATWYGGIFGVNEITFNYGIFNFLTQGVFWYIAYILFALFIVDKISKYNSMTLPELTGQMFGPKSAKIAAAFTFFYILPVAYVLSIGMFLNMVLGISTFKGMVIGALFTCFYSAWGGFRAVVFSEIIQFFVMCVSVSIVIIFSIKAFGGYSFLKESLPASHFSPLGGNSIWQTMIWGFIALATLVDPSFYQRCFAAKTPQVAKRGILISTLVWICFDICTTLGALYARAVIPASEPAHAYFFYAVQLLPVGLKGFFVAGILAIILSTLDSFMFIASNTLSYDFLRNRFKNVILTNRIAMFGVSAVAILLAVLLDGSFKTIWLTLGSYMSACMLIPILTGYIFPKKITDKMFCISAVTSAVFMTLWSITKRTGFWADIDGFYIGVTTSILILSLSVFLKNEKQKSIINM
ncbi:SSS family solute:Na+ symporter [Elusimicrobium posterum]|uniref:sodium:solute symporter family protein n=1 Tax=Elusimicrobium posterum TaxID=3116653 RepID=UPI003C706C3D